MVAPRPKRRLSPGRGDRRPGLTLGPSGEGTPQARRRMYQEAARIDADLVRGRSDPQVDRNLEIYNRRVRSLRKQEAARKLGQQRRRKGFVVSPSGKVIEVDI